MSKADLIVLCCLNGMSFVFAFLATLRSVKNRELIHRLDVATAAELKRNHEAIVSLGFPEEKG